MAIDSNSRLDKGGPKSSDVSNDLSTALSREGNPLGSACDKQPANKTAHRSIETKQFEGVDLAATALLPKFFQVPDKKPARLALLNDQLAKLYPPAGPGSAKEIQRFTEAFERDYATFAPELDDFESSTRLRNSKNPDLAMRQELMDWTNRAAAKGLDNTSPRLSRQQQSELDALEAVDKPNPTADAKLKAKVDRLAEYEKYVSAVRNNTSTAGLKWNSNDYKALKQDPEVSKYLTQKPGQPASGSADRLEGVVNNGDPHHVAHTYRRLAELNQICKDYQNRGQRASSNDAYWRADAERKALTEVNSPKSLGESINQEQLRGMLIRRELQGSPPAGAYTLRRMGDGQFDGNSLPNPLSEDASRIPKEAKAAIDSGVHSPGNADKTISRLVSLQRQCQQDKETSEATGILPFQNYEMWARIAEFKALQEFRGTTEMQKQARALIMRSELLGLSPGDARKLRSLRDTIYAGEDR